MEIGRALSFYCDSAQRRQQPAQKKAKGKPKKRQAKQKAPKPAKVLLAGERVPGEWGAPDALGGHPFYLTYKARLRQVLCPPAYHSPAPPPLAAGRPVPRPCGRCSARGWCTPARLRRTPASSSPQLREKHRALAAALWRSKKLFEKNFNEASGAWAGGARADGARPVAGHAQTHRPAPPKKNAHTNPLPSARRPTACSRAASQDTSIAAFLLCLWARRRERDGRVSAEPAPVSFVEVGCGNGFLTFLLIAEGPGGAR